MTYNAFSTGSQWTDTRNHKFKSLKEEIIESGYVSFKNYRRDILAKAMEYQQTVRAKQAIYHYKGYQGILELREEEKHPLKYGATMTLNHIISLICYTDFSELCTAWTSSFRQIYLGESKESMELRQRGYYYLSKYLYEMVQYFGVACHGKLSFENDRGVSSDDSSSGIHVSWVDEIGPFFCGMSIQMPLPSFNIKLNSPTSTSRAKEVAIRFSGEDGILITFNNNGLHENDRTAFCDASWLSRYKEEEEVYVYTLFLLHLSNTLTIHIYT